MRKTILIISLVLNVLLAAALVIGRTQVREEAFEIAALHAEAEANLTRLYLGILESDREDKIAHLTERMKECIKNAEDAQTTTKQAAPR
jgi:sensor histidine kinase regulating citrate/malate metabolism